MKNKTSFLLLIFLLTLSPALKAEKITLSGSNQLEFSLQNNKYPAWRSFECWSEVVASYKWYNLGFRFEQHLPSDKDSVWDDLTLKYFQMQKWDFDITLGDYYTTFGKGLLLRSYEQRELRYDNNLEGAKINWNKNIFNLTFIWGKGIGQQRQRKDPIIGTDFKIDLLDWLKLGASYLDTKPKETGRTRLLGINGEILLSHLNFYAELAEKYNPQNSFLPDRGRGAYLSSNVFSSGWGLSLEYKDYKDLDFSDGDLAYNQPPALTKEHLYVLLNRNSHILNTDDEKGFQAELNCSPINRSNLVLNYSLTQNHQDKDLFREIYLQAEYDFPEKAQLKGATAYRKSEEESGNPKGTFIVSDLTYYLGPNNSMNFTLEHLLTESDGGGTTYSLIQFYEQVISLSFSHSPVYSITLSHERTTEHLPKRNWSMVSLDFNLDQRNNLSLSFGSRRAGKVCYGGMCTYKPELEGIEAKLLTHF